MKNASWLDLKLVVRHLCIYAYLSMSTLSPDFNSTVQWSSHIVICLSQRFTRALSNTVRSEDWSLMKSCNSVMRCSCSSRCTVSIDACFSSPLSRANTTAKKVAALHDLSVSVDDRLIEIDRGDWTDHLKSDLKKDYSEEYNKFTQTPWLYTGPNAESLSDMGKRGAEALQEIACTNPGKTVLVAAHSDFNKATVCEILALGYEHFNELQQDNTSISILRYDGNWKLCVWNSIPHLGYLTEGIALSDSE